MTDPTFIGGRFFRILLPNFSSKMSIPSALATQLSREKNKDKATLVSHNGKLWHVNLFKEEKRMYMGGENWKEFVQANNLKPGYILILRYKGNFVFSFRVFNRSTWEETQNSANNQNPMKRNHIDNDQPEHENTKFTGSKKKMKAQELILKKEYFEIIIKTWNLSHGFVLIPLRFKTACGISAQHKTISVRDLKGKWWQLGLRHASNAANVTQISKGLRDLFRCNKLEEGDQVAFELVSSQGENKIVKLKMHKR